MVASVLAGSVGTTDFCAAHDGHTLGKCSHENPIRLPLFCRETLIEQIRVSPSKSSRKGWNEIGFCRLRRVGHEALFHECQNTFVRIAVEPDYRLNAIRGNVARRREAGAVDLVMIVVEHICVVGMDHSAIRCMSALRPYRPHMN